MILRNDRHPEGKDMGPSVERVQSSAGVGGGSTFFAHTGAISEGRCPICNRTMGMRSNTGSCVKLEGSSWKAMHNKRGRGGYTFGKAWRVEVAT